MSHPVQNFVLFLTFYIKVHLDQLSAANEDKYPC